MTVSGTIYGVALNDRNERQALATRFSETPYGAPPVAPVVYIKPRQCVARGAVHIPAEVEEVEAAPTIAFLFARDAAKLTADAAFATVGAACLALDVARPQISYHRPAVAGRCSDGFLPLGELAGALVPDAIRTTIDGIAVHRWSTDRLVRPVATLIADLSAFMTLRAGDLLLVGLPGDAPRVRAGQVVTVEATGLPTLRATFEEEGA